MSLLELNNIAKSFDGLFAVRDLSIGFEAGTTTALIGPNGAGKTTLFNIISGLLPPDTGTILFKGENLLGKKPWEIAEAGIGRLFQDIRIFGQMTAEENVMSAFPDQEGELVWKTLFGRRRMQRQEQMLSEKTKDLLEFVGLESKIHEPAMELSYGQQKLLAIARLLASDAELLLLDEPTAGVNPAMISELIDLIKKLPDQGKTILVIEHNMNVVLDISDWVYFVDDGQVVSFGLPNDVLDDPEIRRAYVGV